MNALTLFVMQQVLKDRMKRLELEEEDRARRMQIKPKHGKRKK